MKGILPLYIDINNGIEEYLERTVTDWEHVSDDGFVKTLFIECQSNDGEFLDYYAGQWRKQIMNKHVQYVKYFTPREIFVNNNTQIRITLDRQDNSVTLNIHDAYFYIHGDNEYFDGKTEEECLDELMIVNNCKCRKLILSFVRYVLLGQRHDDLEFEANKEE